MPMTSPDTPTHDRDSVTDTESRLRVNEIFRSLQGESSSAGFPTTFIRLTGCPLRCGYCDTEYAFHEGRWMGIDQILGEVRGLGVRHVTLTGGEPLAQRPARLLLMRLCDASYEVSLETSGAVEIATVDPRVRIVMDVKTPGSGEAEKNLPANLGHLKPGDEVKFVIADRADYEWSREFVARERLGDRCEVLFSPVWRKLEPVRLGEWILEDRLPVRLQVQLHKLLWGEERGR